MNRAGSHLLELINDILDLSKIEAGRFDFYPQTGFGGWILPVQSDVHQSPGNQEIHHGHVYEGSLGVRILADPRRLKQMLVNLLTNAVKFTPNRERSLQVDADENEDLIQFSVIDTGIGIAPKDLHACSSRSCRWIAV